MTSYPNREHAAADAAALARILQDLDAIIDEAATLRLRIERGGAAWRTDAARLGALVIHVTQDADRLETLRAVREWHQADMKEGS
jgi:hypothetical protein